MSVRMNFAYRAATKIAAACVSRLSVVIYHRVLAEPDPLLPAVPDRKRFAQQLDWLNASFNVLPLHEAVSLLTDGRLPARSLCITFDDGYFDNRLCALPVIVERNLCATFFIATAYVDGGMMWNDRVRESLRARVSGATEIDLREFGLGTYPIESSAGRTIDTVIRELKYRQFAEREATATAIYDAYAQDRNDRLMMTRSEILELHQAGMEIGGHTHRHPILAELDDKSAIEEIRLNKEILEDITQTPLRSFAYPNGQPGKDYTLNHTKIVADLGYSCAVSTSYGAASRHCDRFQIPRFTPWDNSQAKYTLRMLKNYFQSPEITA